MKKRNEEGFTLIELMIVIAIIGILAAIAIPNFNAYRARSYNASANSDIKNIMTAQEGYYIDNDEYASSVDTLSSYGYTKSGGVVDATITAGSSAYTVSDVHNSLADTRAVTYTVEGPGGMIGKVTP